MKPTAHPLDFHNLLSQNIEHTKFALHWLSSTHLGFIFLEIIFIVFAVIFLWLWFYYYNL